MKKNLVIIFLLLLQVHLLYSQRADITEGCSPLKVNFTSDTLSNYYWDFDDVQASSTLQNSSHIYTKPGIFKVQLFAGQGGSKIGEIVIKVYERPSISFTSDMKEGCSPLRVNFTKNITIDTSIHILEGIWVFGDGTSSNENDVIHTYNNSGNYSVSYGIKTDKLNCDNTLLMEDYISVFGLNADFIVNKIAICDEPYTIKVTNRSILINTNTYHWDFGNGVTSEEFNPSPITFDHPGIFEIKLIVTNAEGCQTFKIVKVQAGKPTFDIMPDSVSCIKQIINLNNNTNAKTFHWTFGNGSSIPDSDLKNPNYSYKNPGEKEVTLSITDQYNCSADTSFSIFIEDPKPTFTISPEKSCNTPILIKLNANESEFTKYDWSSIPPSPFVPEGINSEISFDDLLRDSLYENIPYKLQILLQIVSKNGCIGSSKKEYSICKPNAHFTVDIASGCVPLSVTFHDKSTSYEKITKWKYLFGNGDEISATNNDPNTYTFNETGEYFVKLVIENEAGCIDTSNGVWIKVGDHITPEFTIDKTEVCLGDTATVTFTNSDPRIDMYHFYTDDGRFDHCWTNKSSSHKFVHSPGEYEVFASLVYNGCITEVEAPYKVTVKGAKADLSYMINCDQPYDVMLSSIGNGATRTKWKIAADSTIDDLDSLVYTFTNSGDYHINLSTWDDVSGCPIDHDSVVVHIGEIKADFTIPDKVCDNKVYTISASTSQDVNNNCFKGYLWYLPNKRPTEYGVDSISTIFPKGLNKVTLITENINGCKDTISKFVTSYAIKPDFKADKDVFCLPHDLQIKNLTVSDTTITSYVWSTGDNIENPIIHLTSLPDTVFILNLMLTDALGCMNQIQKPFQIYKPTTNLSISPFLNNCIGTNFSFSASDFTSYGSHLNFTWAFDDYGQFTEQSNNTVLDKPGTFNLNLIYEEQATGCKDSLNQTINVINVPIANFTAIGVDKDTLCYPTTFSFSNQSIIDGPGFVTWKFNNSAPIQSQNSTLVQTFGKGTQTINLIAKSVYGCADTITKQFTLVGPEGMGMIDKSKICLGEDIIFSASNLVDVTSYEWDFGDGTTDQNVSPIKHNYDRVLSPEAKLILKSAFSGCDLIIDLPFSVNDIKADFEKIDSVNYCEGLSFFQNTSIGANQYSWDFQDGIILSDSNPVQVLFPSSGEYKVTLLASNSQHNCKDEVSKTITLEDVMDFLKVPNIFTPNGDGENDLFRPIIIDPKFEDYVKIKEFKVFNRWGNLVYDNTELNNGWDGLFNGSEAPAEVYAYYLEVEVVGCNTLSRKGGVTLIR